MVGGGRGVVTPITSVRVARAEANGRTRQRRKAQVWLGAGAFTLGLGAVMAGGTGTAHAVSAAPSASPASNHAGTPASGIRSAGGLAGPRRTLAVGTGRHLNTGVSAQEVRVGAEPASGHPAASFRPISAAPGRLPVLRAPAVGANSLIGVLTGVLTALGLNKPTAPADPLGAWAWGVLRTVETHYGLTPVAGTPTVGSFNLVAGTVNGTLGFTEPAGQPLTYSVTTNPEFGSVTVTSAGAFTYTYTPTAATGAAITDVFTVTATDGLAATSEAVTVPLPDATTSAGAMVTGPSGLVIHLVWDASVAGAPPSFKTTVEQAAQMIEATVTNKVTLNIAVGYGEIGGTPIGSGSAEGATLGDQQESYATVKGQLTSCDTTAVGQAVVAHLPVTNPFGSLTYDVSGAQLKVFGVDAANGTQVDGEVGFSTDWPSADLLAAALHELTHAMGRNSGWGSAANGYDVTPLDLSRYSAPGALVCDGSVATAAHLQYFSVDGGTTVLADYSDSSDYGDWSTNSLTPTDPYDAYVASNSNALTAVDVAVLDAIGYTTV